MTQVIPTIIPESFEELKVKVERVADYVPLVQIDIVDGVYAPPLTWPFTNDPENKFKALVRGTERLPHHDTLRYELDFMVRDPEVVLDVWIAAGFSQFIIHLESTQDMSGIISRLRTAKKGVGIALKPNTHNDALIPFIDSIDFVQCMGNDKIGYHGVPLDPRAVEKIKELHAQYPTLVLGVDIGVNFETAPRLTIAGATRLAAGSVILKSDDPARAILRLSGEDLITSTE